MNPDDKTTETTTETVDTEATEQTPEAVAETIADPLDAITDPDELRKAAKAQRSIAQRYKKSSVKETPALTTTKPDISDDVVAKVNRLDLSEKKRQFGYKNGLSPEETDKLFKYAGNDKPEEALKDPFFQSGLTEFRKQNSVKSAIPRSTNRTTSSVEGKSFKDMTPAEREKNWGKITNQE